MQQEKANFVRALNTAQQWLAYGDTRDNEQATQAALIACQNNAETNQALQQYRSAISKGQTAVAAEMMAAVNTKVDSILSAYAEWFKVWHSATPSENAGQF